MNKYFWMLPAAVVIGALRVNEATIVGFFCLFFFAETNAWLLFMTII